MTEKQIKDIVQREIKTYLSDKFEKEFEKLLKTKKSKDLISDIIKNALINFYKFLYIKRAVWGNELK